MVAAEISGPEVAFEDFEVLFRDFLVANLKVRDKAMQLEDTLFAPEDFE